MHINGKYKGTYYFSKNSPDILKNKKTNFEMEIKDHEKTKISGSIIDIDGLKGIGVFTGTVKSNKIQFIKKMPIKTFILPNGKKIELNKPHRPIFYTGDFNNKTNNWVGTWKFKIGLGFFDGKLVFYPATKGSWEMKKVLV